MTESEYQPGGLSQLLSLKSQKKSPGSKKKTVIPKKDKLDVVFNDPTAHEYAVKDVVPEPDPEPVPNPTEERRKDVREKSKLVKMRQKEKTETGYHTVFVGNIPVEAEKKDIMKFFMKYGKITSMRFRNLMRKDLTMPMKASAIKKDLHPLCKSKNAYIVFEEEKSATRALKRNGKELLGSHLRVDLASSATDREPNRKSSIFIGNVPFDAHEERLREHFSECGTIVNIRLIRDKETRLGKGFGYIEFQSPDGVSLALQMDGHKFGKNKLRVQRCLKHTKQTVDGNTQKSKSWSGSMSDRQNKFTMKGKGKKVFEGKRPKKLKAGHKTANLSKSHKVGKSAKAAHKKKDRKSVK